jgi:hypothetical protein
MNSDSDERKTSASKSVTCGGASQYLVLLDEAKPQIQGPRRQFNCRLFFIFW